MSAVEELLAQYRQKAQISKSRKRPRETITADLVAERTTKNKTEKTSQEHIVLDVQATPRVQQSTGLE